MAPGAKSRPSAMAAAAAVLVLLAVTLAATAADDTTPPPPPCTSADLGAGEPCVGVLGHSLEDEHPGIGVAVCCDALDRLEGSCAITCGFLNGLESDFLRELGNSTDKTCISVKKKKDGLCK